MVQRFRGFEPCSIVMKKPTMSEKCVHPTSWIKLSGIVEKRSYSYLNCYGIMLRNLCVKFGNCMLQVNVCIIPMTGIGKGGDKSSTGVKR